MIDRLRESIDELADKILDVQSGTGIGDVRHWSPERMGQYCFSSQQRFPRSHVRWIPYCGIAARLQHLLALRAQKQEQLEAAEQRALLVDDQQEVAK